MNKLLLALLLVLGATDAIAAEKHVIELVIREHRFEPAEITAPSGVPIEIKVKNLDKTAEEFESIALRREKVVGPGKQITISLNPLDPGRYKFFGEYNPDTAVGYLVVK